MQVDIQRLRQELFGADRPALAQPSAASVRSSRVAGAERPADPVPEPLVVAPPPRRVSDVPNPLSIAPPPWLTPAVGGVAAFGSPDEQVRTLMELHETLDARTDPVGRHAAAAVRAEIEGFRVFLAHINSLVE